ncbi:MAG TPA: hypothetical protein VJ810_08655 [Blastocatellia bacterium]|nr:hypothetical protein [Blastocatellia bacterium]
MTNQLDVTTAYIDEWGVIAPEVHRAALALHKQAEIFARVTLHNEDAGHTLLAKAAAIVTRALKERPGTITNIPAYLFKTYKRQVLAELEKERSHEQILVEHGGEASVNGHDACEELDQQILVRELRRLMDERTREVFDLLVLGHSFEEIGLILGKSSRAVRNNYYDHLNRLKKELA